MQAGGCCGAAFALPPPLQGGATASWADQQGQPLPRVASGARRLAWERLARSLHSCVSSSHRSSSFGSNCSRGSFPRTTRYTWDRVVRGIFSPIPAASPAGMPRPAGTWRYGDASPPSSGSRIRPAPRRPSQSRTPFQCAIWNRPRTPGSPGSAFWGVGQVVARLAAVQVYEAFTVYRDHFDGEPFTFFQSPSRCQNTLVLNGADQNPPPRWRSPATLG